ncbi:MAG: SPASM domain-containing protein, partial [Candidatus Omnitrophota bacterium]
YPSQIKRRHEYQLKVIRNILEASRNYIFEKHLLPEIPYISNYVTPFFFPRIGNSLCPAGFTSFTVDADGEIYLCDSAILSNFFKIGNVKESFPATFKNILVLQDKIVSSLSKCRDCWAMGFCGGSCHIARIQDKIDSEYCNYIKNRSLSIINLLCRVTPDQIIKWYKNRKINKRNKKKGKIEFYQKLHNVFYFHDELIKRLTHLRPLYISFLSNEKRNLYQNCR